MSADGGRRLGERGILQRAAVDRDRLVGEVFLAFDFQRGGSNHGDVVGCIGGREIDDLLALLRIADAHQEIDPLFGEVGDAVLAGHGDRIELHLQRVGDRLRDVHVVSLQAHIGAGRGEGREVGKDADIDLAGGGDVVDGVGIGLTARPNGAPNTMRAAMEDLKRECIVMAIPLFCFETVLFRLAPLQPMSAARGVGRSSPSAHRGGAKSPCLHRLVQFGRDCVASEIDGAGDFEKSIDVIKALSVRNSHRRGMILKDGPGFWDTILPKQEAIGHDGQPPASAQPPTSKRRQHGWVYMGSAAMSAWGGPSGELLL